jgi:hypothetical protein
MRYLFTLIIVAIIWVITVLIALQETVTTSDRFVFYLTLIFLTVGLYKIGFARK